MIYLCQACGHRINQRTSYRSSWRPDEPLEKTGIPDEEIGVHLIYKHKAFCSEYCIELAKSKPCILEREVIPYDFFERGDHNPDRPNGIETWKTERKIRRPKRVKNKIL